MSENLRIVATGVLAKINVMLEVAKGSPQEFTPTKITEYLSAFKVQLKDALKLYAAEKKLATTSDTDSVILNLAPGLGYAMSNTELRQAINDTTTHLRPLITGIQLSELARQTLGDHLECLLQVEKARAGIMFASAAVTDTGSTLTKTPRAEPQTHGPE
ncbi:MAG: hypothetical protein L0H10_04105 [Comamonas sp.]|uniref:hypothetical protein n=1 Tax=Comamonas sp. TaxID=34028 RepID=UPI0026493C7A|nr:hypothetical protein [Comamonas sp.]MDN5502989.1 hypothetical protein [Comamonas sp.]MDN5539614.1 hypothetical protein [Comamonas sp.]